MNEDGFAIRRVNADIVFLVDISTRVPRYLDDLKTNINVLMERMSALCQKHSLFGWRIKVCGYRDVSQDGVQWWEEKPFTSDLSQVHTDLALLEAKGESDGPIPLLDGLSKLAKMPVTGKGESADANFWRHHSDAKRFVIALTNQPCCMMTSTIEAGRAGFEDVAREVMAARLQLSLYAPETDCYQTVSAIDKCEWTIIDDATNVVEILTVNLPQEIMGSLFRAETKV